MKTKKGFVLREICGENLVVAEGRENIDFNNVIAMNETAAFIWQNIVGKDFTIDDMVQCILAEYDAEESQVRTDCEELAKRWSEAGIID